MKKDFLLDAIGQIDDELLLDAELAPPRPRRWPYWGGLAAALAVCVGLWAAAASGVLPGVWLGSGSSDAPNFTGGAMAPGAASENSVASDAMPPSGEPSSGGSMSGGDVNAEGADGKLPPVSAEMPEETDKRAGPRIFIDGRQYIPGVSTDQPLLHGTALGELTCPDQYFDAVGGDEDGEGGPGALLTNAPEYDGLPVWEEAGQYYLELPDGSFLTLVPWEE